LKKVWLAIVFFCMCVCSSHAMENHQETQQVGQPLMLSDQEKQQCVICIESIEKDQRLLPCGHTFHESCMCKWEHYQKEKLRDVLCPICRFPLSEQIDHVVITISDDDEDVVDQEQSLLCEFCGRGAVCCGMIGLIFIIAIYGGG
jgi:hypothetical protein